MNKSVNVFRISCIKSDIGCGGAILDDARRTKVFPFFKKR